MTAVDAEFGLC